MKRKICISLLLLFLILNITIFAIIKFSSSDKIIQSDKSLIGNTTLYNYITEKGEEIEVVLEANSKTPGEDIYLFEIILNGRNSTYYNAENASLIFKLPDSTEILSLFCSGNGPDYFIPNIKYADNCKYFECKSDGCYAHVKMLLSGEKAEEVNLTLQYDIIGKGIYSFNKFYGMEDNISF